MTHYYQCQKCGKVFATWRMGETHAEKDGHSSILSAFPFSAFRKSTTGTVDSFTLRRSLSIPLSKGAGVDQDIVITDYDNV